MRAGLIGGKNVPIDVRQHPRLFVTLTAPGFGPVHRATEAQPCHPRRKGRCEHGRSNSCSLVHTGTDPRIGQPLCPHCYDYTGHVLWHAHAGRLWKAFTDNLYHHLARRTGLSRSALRRSVRISYAKVAEYQKRAAVHIHAVMRLDGMGGPGDPPPAWATASVLADAVRTAAAVVGLTVPYDPALGEYELRWGSQLDVRPLHAAGGPELLTDDAVAAYVAKYVSKGAADTGAGLDHPLKSAAEIITAPVSDHIRTLMTTCWRLGGLPGLQALRLRAWTHTLGYRGHILTKSHRYSTTYATLRADRAEHRGAAVTADEPSAVTDSHWRYAGSGHTPGAALVAAGIADDLARNREAVREASATGTGSALGAG